MLREPEWKSCFNDPPLPTISSAPLAANRGRFLAEVFSVLYHGKTEVTPDKQLGTIKVRNHRYHHFIYNVDKLDRGKASIKHGDELTLTGPTLAPVSCPSGYLVIEVDLFCGAFKGSTRIDWAPVPGDECKSLKRDFVSKDGQISVFLGMFFYATEALIEFSLSTKDSSDICVGGRIAARTSKFRDQKFSSLLFLETGQIKVHSGESIPLSRSLTVVPLGYKMFLDIRLVSDGETVSETLEFDASLDGTYHKTLPGTKCEIKAKVIWNVKHESVGALNDRCVYSDEESDEE
ncbi:hypothetical protein POM88_002125 [Heracleum sosnowskyi]|uniref:DUF6598 domain-containing protein n=1 Tax=Heracleum sosnowskyi TaxID=360622 RepID=A0AAD8JHX6_9APIA|nr:hypothetical protein POM88_002125 [Heracleum sosnowskyi]